MKRIISVLLVMTMLMSCFTVFPFAVESDANVNPLKGKSVLFVGDSICDALYEDGMGLSYAGWAGRIMEENGMAGVNRGTSGASLSNTRADEGEPGTIYQQLQAEAGKTYDYVILHGGVNDAWDAVAVGTMTSGTNASFDRDTYAGALEATIKYAKETFPTAKIGYIINFSLPSQTTTGNLADMSGYFSMGKKICEKWGIPYLNLYEDDDFNKNYIKSHTNKGLYDFVHPNVEGYNVLAPVINDWMKTIDTEYEDNSSFAKNLIYGSSVTIDGAELYDTASFSASAFALTDGTVPHSVWSKDNVAINDGAKDGYTLNFKEFSPATLTSAKVVFTIDNASAYAKPSSAILEAYVDGSWVEAGTFDLSHIPSWSDDQTASGNYSAIIDLRSQNLVATKVRLVNKPTGANLIGEVQVMGKYLPKASAGTGYETVTQKNIAYGKTVTITRGNGTDMSAQYTYGCGAIRAAASVLTNGKAYNSHDPYSGEWTLFQNYHNTVVEQNGWGKKTEMIVDLGKAYNIGEIKVHLANVDSISSIDDRNLISTPEAINVYFSNDKKTWTSSTYLDYNSYASTYWTSAKVLQSARYVKVEVVLNLVYSGAVPTAWGAIVDEIAVYENESLDPTAAPTTLPAIRQWTDGVGAFIPNADTTLVYAGGDASEQVKLVQGFFKDTLGLDLPIRTSGTSNAIIFKTSASACNGEDEGYDLVATANSVTITAKTNIGLLYGGISVVQSVDADGYFPAGTAKDYPAYKVRTGLIDVARLYMPMDELMNLTRYMAWFKFNEIHVHINDNGKNGYSAFRLESDIPGLTATDGYYTKEEYRQYQLEAAKYGVSVLTEIDSPHHARCFSTVNIDGWTPKLLTVADGVSSNEANRALDVRDEKTVQLIESIFTEYLGGDNPVILNDTIHIGMDEYPKIFPEESEAYINRIIKHVNSLGYTARFWSSFGSNGFLNGATLDSGMDYDTIYWDSTHSGYNETVALNCGIVNYLNNYLYIVPGWNNQPRDSFEDYLTDESAEYLYNEFQIHRWSAWNKNAVLYPEGDERMLGGGFSIWNDYGSAWIGLTYTDVIDRVRNMGTLVAEKCWCGADTGTIDGTISFANFKARRDALAWRAGDVDIFNRDLPEGGININFENGVPSYATISGSISNGKLVLDGNSYVTTAPKYDFVGMPNTLSFDIKLDELPSERAYIFDSEDRNYLGETKAGFTKIFVDPDGTIGFESLLSEADDTVYGRISFIYHYKLTAGIETKITLTCALPKAGTAGSSNLLVGSRPSVTTLVVNDTLAFEPVSSLAEYVTGDFYGFGTYSTLTIPLYRIGLGVKGTIDNIKVTGSSSAVPALGEKNILLGSSATITNLKEANATSYPKSAMTDGVVSAASQVWSNKNYGLSVIDRDQTCYITFDAFDATVLTGATVYLVNDIPSSIVKPVTMTLQALVDGKWVDVSEFNLSHMPKWSATGKELDIMAAVIHKIPEEIATTQVRLAYTSTGANWISEVQVYGYALAEGSQSVNHAAVGKPATDLSGKPALDSSNGVFKFGDVLTDGIAQNSFDATNDTWFGIQTYHNCTNGVASLVVDLGKEISIDKIKLHLANSNKTFTLNGVSGTINAPEPQKVELFISSDGSNYTSAGVVDTSSDANIVYWTNTSIMANARYVKVCITVATDAVTYALIDEIAVYECETPIVPEPPIDTTFETIEHDAVSKTVTDPSGKEPLDSINGVFKFADVLTDGIAQNGFDATNDTWFTFQRWHNCTDYVGSVIVDMGEIKTIDRLKLHLANSDKTFTVGTASAKIDALAPVKIEVFVSSDNESYASVGTITPKSDMNIVYWTDELTIDKDARYVKVTFTLPQTVSVPYALIDEIAIYNAAEVVPEPEYILGDVNNDGKLTATDYMMLKKIIFDMLDVEDLKAPETAALRCDLNGDGKYTSIDYFMLKKLIFS